MILASHAGFCFGVRRAVEAAEKAAPAVTLGPIIHNPQVVSRLESLGVRSVERVEEIPSGARAIIRSHGVSREVMEALNARGLTVIDATCPFVARIHEMARAASEAGVPLIVIGESHHPEVCGILGWTRGAHYAVRTPEDVDRLPEMERALIVSQTTMVESEFRALCAQIERKVRLPDVRMTICPATRDRQSECMALARTADRMIVIGGRDSSNSRKLYALAAQLCPQTSFIESADELKGLKISPTDTIGNYSRCIHAGLYN